uniref:Uncharacterized protein n=1 Tax=Romanomermis culicivorax TaxID=13658 RepID=A0A915KMT9_ROMCU
MIRYTRAASAPVFTNSFYVRLHQGGQEHAHSIAKRHGFVNVGRVLGSENEWHFVAGNVPKARTRRSVFHSRKLNSDPQVARAVQQPGYKRSKRGYTGLKEKLKALDFAPLMSPTDPLYKFQWYLKNTGQGGGKERLDLNVEKAWALGYTGKNITTAIMDDGVDYMHPDLKDNFNAAASYDFSSNDPYPYPRYTDDWFNSHGTRCAGEIAAARDNGVCGVGVAYNSKIA